MITSWKETANNCLRLPWMCFTLLNHANSAAGKQTSSILIQLFLHWCVLPQMPVFIEVDTWIGKNWVWFSCHRLQCWEINKKKSVFYLLAEQFWFENHWQMPNMGPHNEMFTVPFQRGTPLWNWVEVCGKFAEQDMCRGRKLKHDGTISIQGLRKKMVFIFLMFLLNWQDDPFHLWFLG